MHGEHLPAIHEAFEAASRRHAEYQDVSNGDDDKFFDLFDLYYDAESWIDPETIEAAFSIGQENPTATRYSCWWGSAVVWFVGDPDLIIKRLRDYQPPPLVLDEQD